MNRDWQLVIETLDGACSSSPDSTVLNNNGSCVWEIVQVQSAAEGALVL